jgi:hypothetical protein
VQVSIEVHVTVRREIAASSFPPLSNTPSSRQMTRSGTSKADGRLAGAPGGGNEPSGSPPAGGEGRDERRSSSSGNLIRAGHGPIGAIPRLRRDQTAAAIAVATNATYRSTAIHPPTRISSSRSWSSSAV